MILAYLLSDTLVFSILLLQIGAQVHSTMQIYSIYLFIVFIWIAFGSYNSLTS